MQAPRAVGSSPEPCQKPTRAASAGTVAVLDEVADVIAAGAFAAGERLPPVRRLAIDLGVHHNTVAQAYRKLADEGWLDLARGRGATVLDRAAPRNPGREARDGWRQRLAELVAQGVASGLPSAALAEALTAAAKQVLP